MLVNSFVVTYLVCSSCSLLIGLLAALNGFSVVRAWDITSPTEEQYEREKRIYLIITLVSLGLVLRLLMIPLWFGTLMSMLPSLPGAMCLSGVHSSGSPGSYPASALKLALPPFYIAWLVLNGLDRRVISQPFLKMKLLLLMPLGFLMICEAALDISFFLSITPRQVSCCTSLLELPQAGIAPVVTHFRGWLILAGFCLFLVWGEMCYFLAAQKKSLTSNRGWWFGSKTVMVLEFSYIVATFILFVLALHREVSSLILCLPRHQCIFCLLQKSGDSLLSFSLIYGGLTLFLVYFLVVSLRDYGALNMLLGQRILSLLKWSLALLTGGMIILSLHLLLALWKS